MSSLAARTIRSFASNAPLHRDARSPRLRVRAIVKLSKTFSNEAFVSGTRAPRCTRANLHRSSRPWPGGSAARSSRARNINRVRVERPEGCSDRQPPLGALADQEESRIPSGGLLAQPGAPRRAASKPAPAFRSLCGSPSAPPSAYCLSWPAPPCAGRPVRHVHPRRRVNEGVHRNTLQDPERPR